MIVVGGNDIDELLAPCGLLMLDPLLPWKLRRRSWSQIGHELGHTQFHSMVSYAEASNAQATRLSVPVWQLQEVAALDVRIEDLNSLSSPKRWWVVDTRIVMCLERLRLLS
jgi:hypothetical protein